MNVKLINIIFASITSIAILFFHSCGGGKGTGEPVLEYIIESEISSDLPQYEIIETFADETLDTKKNEFIDLTEEDIIQAEDIQADDKLEVIQIIECIENAKCETGLCLKVKYQDYEGICTKECIDEKDCPEDFFCEEVLSFEEKKKICVPPVSFSCLPCDSDEKCVMSKFKCFTIDKVEGAVCIEECSGENKCLSDFVCKDIEGKFLCVPKTMSCSCNEQNDEIQRVCSIKNEFGECSGLETCDKEIGWTGCTAKTPEKEKCNDIDDNCDGNIDENISGDECSITNKNGTCKGNNICINGNWKCDAKTPMAEKCDLEDNDCDDITDEEGATGCKIYYFDGDNDGFGDCNKKSCLCAGENEYTANACGDCDDNKKSVNPEAEEICNGIDDDCNDKIDELCEEGILILSSGSACLSEEKGSYFIIYSASQLSPAGNSTGTSYIIDFGFLNY